MTDARHITEDEATRAAEYALGLMTASERRAFEAEMAALPALQAEVRGWDHDLTPLTREVSEVSPPRHVQTGLEQRLFGAPARRGLWSSLTLWRGMAGAAIAGVVVLALMLNDRLTPPPVTGEGTRYVAQMAAQDGAVQIAALFDPARGVLQINRVAGAPAQGRDYELWLIPGGAAPISLGVLPADRRGQIVVPSDLRDRFGGATLAISDEPPGGSPTGQATGPVVALGPVTTL